MKHKVGKYYLDKEQSSIVEDNHKHTLVIAGAGSGKTLTILGKIQYLIKQKNISPKEIICISFTQAASNDLKRKIQEDLKLDLDVYTFHKLALEIIKQKSYFDIADSLLLEDLTHVFFMEEIYKDKDALKLAASYFKIPVKEYEKFYNSNNKEIINLEHLLTTFLRLFKSNAYSYPDFLDFLESSKKTFRIKKYKREKILLTLAINLYTRYQSYLKDNKEIDFDDMLTIAKSSVEKYGFFHKVKYIIVDEYQDTSMIRFNLIKNILDKTNASLLVVGDDFQSIYRFTGCDLELFLNFKKMFPDGNIKKIQTTYRNSQELISAAGKFVMKNRCQMTKKLKSDLHLDRPIVIKYYNSPKREFLNLVKKIYQETEKEILVLGRNNKDIYSYIDEKTFLIKDNELTYKENKSIKIKYLTAHKSKGLEATNVIIINLRDDSLGFPNQMKDDKLLRFVSPHSSKYPFDEERRLFYVALTRTKNKVYLLVPKNNKSIFVEEIEKDFKKIIEHI